VDGVTLPARDGAIGRRIRYQSVMELTTVADDEAVVHDGVEVRVHDGLAPDTVYELDGFTFRTLARPAGELLCRFATVNDVHIGEIEAGLIEGMEMGPTFCAEEGDPPYPEMMSRGAISEIQAIDPAAVVVKGDLTSRGTEEEYGQFRDLYEPAFGDRLHVVRGNHDSYYGATFASDAPFTVELPGVVLAVIDTAREHHAAGAVTDGTLSWLRELASGLADRGDDRPVLVFGHHHVWNPESEQRPESYFGVNPDDSEALVALVAEHPNIRGYFAGHTHRNRVRRFTTTRDVPWVEVASVKEYPGAWAEYRVYETGILQIMRRIARPECMAWSEKTRHMYAGMYADYAFGELADRCFVIRTR
jgi:3',5'-cyclic-AMP phosphodiesterase